MNTETGEIIELISADLEQFLLENEGWKEVNKKDITEKQNEHKCVSLKDHRSHLGKILTKSRKERRAAFKNNNKNRSKFRLK